MIDPVAAIDLLHPHPSISWYEDVHDAISGVTTDAPLDRVVLIPYIGLNDENGNEVYAGTILGRESPLTGVTYYYKVVWDDENARYMSESITGTLRELVSASIERCCTVYGNVWQHPHLLGGNQE
jgi:hypothetical protein